MNQNGHILEKSEDRLTSEKNVRALTHCDHNTWYFTSDLKVGPVFMITYTVSAL